MKFLILLINFLVYSYFNPVQATNDFLFKKQWGLKNTGQETLKWENELKRELITGIPGVDINWINIKKTEKEVIVAVLDHGLDLNHPDLQGRVWKNPKCVDGQENENIPCHGFDFLDKTTDITDTVGHGTQVSGIIAANQNDIGITGITPASVKIMPLKVLNDKLDGINSVIYNKKYLSDIWADAIRFAVENKADVINMSMGWPKFLETPKLRKAVEIALENNITIVVAPGNNGKEIQTYPCSYDGVICVGAINNTGDIPEYSNYGSKVDILAPGDSIVSTIPSNVHSDVLRIRNYDSAKGTSFATPFVTGVVATLKSLFPEITNDEIMARIYSSSKTVKTTTNKFAKYGLIDMEKSLFNSPKTFISPNYKKLTEVIFNKSNGTFKFELPVKSYLKDEKNLKVQLTSLSREIILDKGSFEIIELLKGSEHVLEITGKVSNLISDYRKSLKVDILDSSNKVISTTRTSLYFARDITAENNAITLPIENVNPKAISFFRGDQRFSRLRRVSDKYAQLNSPQYFAIDPSLQKNDESTVITLITTDDATIKGKELKIPKVDKVLSIFRADINMDGSLDYFIYSLKSSTKGPLVFSFYSEGLKPLFGKKSHWNFEITTFEGLPLKDEGEVENFSWLKVKNSSFGNILVPTFTKVWKMPEVDQSDDILRSSENNYASHLYYLEPIVNEDDVSVRIRAFDSDIFYDDISEGRYSSVGLNPQYYDIVSLEQPFHQDLENLNKGRVHALLATGTAFKRDYFMVQITDSQNFTIIPYFLADHSFIASNNVLPVLDLSNGSVPSKQSVYLAKMDRISARVKILETKSKSDSDPIILKVSSWGDKIFDYVAGFNDPTNTFFIESRFNLYALDKNGQLGSLPVNRDTSFPTMNFTEMLTPLNVEENSSQNSAALPAIHIDSSLVSHDHVYTMVRREAIFDRPMNLSIKVPKNCAVEKPKRWGKEKKFHYVFLCRDEKGLHLKTIPMQLD